MTRILYRPIVWIVLVCVVALVVYAVFGSGLAGLSTGAAGAPGSAPAIALKALANGFDDPVYMTHAGDGSGRLFVVEKSGTIRIVRDGRPVTKPFLDITKLVRSSGSEQGLLSVAFHPHYTSTGLFFIYYTNTNGDVTIARY